MRELGSQHCVWGAFPAEAPRTAPRRRGKRRGCGGKPFAPPEAGALVTRAQWPTPRFMSQCPPPTKRALIPKCVCHHPTPPPHHCVLPPGYSTTPTFLLLTLWYALAKSRAIQSNNYDAAGPHIFAIGFCQSSPYMHVIRPLRSALPEHSIELCLSKINSQ